MTIIKVLASSESALRARLASSYSGCAIVRGGTLEYEAEDGARTGTPSWSALVMPAATFAAGGKVVDVAVRGGAPDVELDSIIDSTDDQR